MFERLNEQTKGLLKEIITMVKRLAFVLLIISAVILNACSPETCPTFSLDLSEPIQWIQNHVASMIKPFF